MQLRANPCHSRIDTYRDGLKKPEACILRIYTSAHELKCMQEKALIIDAVTKHMIGAAAAR